MSEIISKATTRQLALDIFEDMFADGRMIDTSPKDIGFQRTNFLVKILDLGVAARRLVDAAYFIVAQENEALSHYDVELNYFKWLMRYDSRNHTHLRAVISEAQRALIQVTDTPSSRAPNDNDLWVSVQLLGIVGIRNGRIRFEVPSQLLRHIRDPEKSHWLSLRITSAFTLSAARALYDNLQRYGNGAVGEWISLPELREWTGKSGASTMLFKYFKRDTLEPAVKQINELSDLAVSYETRTESTSSKKIDRVRFRVSRKEVAEAVRVNLHDAQALYLGLKNEFGLSQKQFELISANRAVWTDDRLRQAMDYTRFKINQGKVNQSPAGYLMKALEGQWKISEAERTMVKVLEDKAGAARAQDEVKASLAKQIEATHAARDAAARSESAKASEEGRAYLAHASERERHELIRAYLATPPGKLQLKRMKFDAALSDEEVLAHPDLSFALGNFVHLKLKKKRGEGSLV
ncbi:replication initiation protein (plasmid) [Robbsia andropogonis]|uniref:replication initiation protein n=1 Tax=Robbsia andropogonis TaxID=28092 RepID=UPI003D1C11A7